MDTTDNYIGKMEYAIRLALEHEGLVALFLRNDGAGVLNIPELLRAARNAMKRSTDASRPCVEHVARGCANVVLAQANHAR